MPGVQTQAHPPPVAFHHACERWARDEATSYDKAVLTSLITQTPLPEPYSPTEVGYSLETRLPPTETLHLFHLAKDAARASHHASATTEATNRILTALTTPLSNSLKPLPFPSTLSTAPLCAGISKAAINNIGNVSLPQWTIPMADLCAAGEDFVEALRSRQWIPTHDPEQQIVIWTAPDDIGDCALATFAIKMGRNTTDVLPAGVYQPAPGRRKSGTVAGRIVKPFLKTCVKIGTRLQKSHSKRRNHRDLRGKHLPSN